VALIESKEKIFDRPLAAFTEADFGVRQRASVSPCSCHILQSKWGGPKLFSDFLGRLLERPKEEGRFENLLVATRAAQPLTLQI